MVRQVDQIFYPPGQSLYRNNPQFRAIFNHCDNLYQVSPFSILPMSILSVCCDSYHLSDWLQFVLLYLSIYLILIYFYIINIIGIRAISRKEAILSALRSIPLPQLSTRCSNCIQTDSPQRNTGRSEGPWKISKREPSSHREGRTGTIYYAYLSNPKGRRISRYEEEIIITIIIRTSTRIIMAR